MARYTGPKRKIEKRLGLRADVPSQQSPRQRRRRLSDYGLRLREKQKLKFVYGLLERQFRRYVEQATKDPQNTGLVLLQLLELRLDNLVYRLGFSQTRRQARQLVNHGHVLVDISKVDIPSYNVKVGQNITLAPQALKLASVVGALKKSQGEPLPGWLERKGPAGRMQRLPQREEIRMDIDESLVVEYYSR